MKCVGRKLELVTVNGRQIHPKIIRMGNREWEFDEIEFKEIAHASAGTCYFITTAPPRDDEVILRSGNYMDEAGNVRKPEVLKASFVAQIAGAFTRWEWPE